MIKLIWGKNFKYLKKPFISFNIDKSKYIRIFMHYNFSTLSQRQYFVRKFQQGKYYQVLGFQSSTNINAIEDLELKKHYYGMIKMYHSDKVIDETQKINNQQITKCIIRSFEIILQNRKGQQKYKSTYQEFYKMENEVAMDLFGKKFDDIKYDLYKKENQQKRRIFVNELNKRNKMNNNYDQSTYQSAHYSSYQQYNMNGNQNSNTNHNQGPMPTNIKPNLKLLTIRTIITIFLTFALSIGIYEWKVNQDRSELKKSRKDLQLDLGAQKRKKIQQNSIQAHQRKISTLIDSYVKQQPPALKLSNKKDPDQLQQLLEYTISTDIQLYEVPVSLMADKQKLQKLKHVKNAQEILSIDEKFQPFWLSKIRPNTQITLSLQAERCLQNIYIKVKDVASQIEETGKYTPPKVFFRFYGYIMFEIRNKPLSLLNYRDTQYVSLFDLFFDHYSPIPFKRHQYNEYLVGLQDQNLRLYGQVHINHRKIPERYITKNDKVVVMKDELSQSEQKYSKIWDEFYRKHMVLWTRQNCGRTLS